MSAVFMSENSEVVPLIETEETERSFRCTERRVHLEGEVRRAHPSSIVLEPEEERRVVAHVADVRLLGDAILHRERVARMLDL